MTEVFWAGYIDTWFCHTSWTDRTIKETKDEKYLETWCIKEDPKMYNSPGRIKRINCSVCYYEEINNFPVWGHCFFLHWKWLLFIWLEIYSVTSNLPCTKEITYNIVVAFKAFIDLKNTVCLPLWSKSMKILGFYCLSSKSICQAE